MSQRAARSSPGHDVRPFVKAKQKKRGQRTRHQTVGGEDKTYSAFATDPKTVCHRRTASAHGEMHVGAGARASVWPVACSRLQAMRSTPSRPTVGEQLSRKYDSDCNAGASGALEMDGGWGEIESRSGAIASFLFLETPLCF